jgi:hypothetical protein
VDTVYRKILLPILERARESREILNIPTCPGTPCSKRLISCRVKAKTSQSLRDSTLVIGRELSSYTGEITGPKWRTPAPPTRSSVASSRSARLAYSIFEDLTGITFRQLKEFNVKIWFL